MSASFASTTSALPNSFAWSALVFVVGLGLGMLLMTLFQALRNRKNWETHESNQARRDPLSGLANRLALDEFLDTVLPGNTTGGPIGLLIVDIDHFKPINDTHGHRAGDMVLERVGSILRSAAQGAGVVARLGGDEFAIVFASGASRELAQAAERIRAAIERAKFSIGSGISELSLTVSVGVAPSRADDSRGVLLERADQAMYRAKRSGRNQVCVAESDGLAAVAPHTAR